MAFLSVWRVSHWSVQMQSHWLEVKAMLPSQVFFWLIFKSNFETFMELLINKTHPVFFTNFCLVDCAMTESTTACSVLMKELRKVFPQGPYTATDENHFKVVGGYVQVPISFSFHFTHWCCLHFLPKEKIQTGWAKETAPHKCKEWDKCCQCLS